MQKSRQVPAMLCALMWMLLLTHQAFAQMEAGRSVEITGQRSNQQFLAGDTVRVAAQVADDVFAMGRQVTVEAARVQSLIAAAGRLVIRDSTMHDLIAGGLDVELHGTVEDDAVVAVCPVCWWAARRILIARDARIGDEARLWGATIVVDGSIGGALQATARRIVISGVINGPADLKAAEIVLMPTARLGGVLTARSPVPPDIAAGAVIAGEVRHVQTQVNIPDDGELPRRLGWMIGVMAIAGTAGLLVLAALIQITVPAVVQDGADRLRTEPWTSLGVGLAIAVLTPMIAMLLMMTVIGIPIGFLAMAALFVLAAIGFVTLGYAIGLWLRRRMTRNSTLPGYGARVGWSVAGAIVLILFNVVPVLGWLAAMLCLIAGLGAATAAVADRLSGSPATAPSAP